MARLVFTPRALQDIERLTEFLMASELGAAGATAKLLFNGLRTLKNHPLIGRPAELGYRELLISRGRSGYVALYKYDVQNNLALVLAIRHQREGGFGD